MSLRIAKVIAFAAAASGLVAATGVIASSRAATGSLVAAYAFNEGAGTVLHDSSGTGNNGAIANATWVTTGKYGGALSFNGSSSRVTVPDSASLHVSSAMTLEAWVDPATTTAAWRDVIYKGNDNYYLEGTSDQSGRPGGGGTFGTTIGTSALPANTWTHLAVTYDKTTVRLYANGTQVSTLAATGAIASSTNPLSIGSDAVYGQYFSGLIDDVRVYNVALTAAQIQTDMTTPVAPPAPDTTPPLAPGTLTATAISSSRVDLSWGAASDNVGVTGYHIERCQGAGCSNFTEIATTGATTGYSDTSATAGTSYSYRVRANDAALNLGPYSNTATATTPAGGTGVRKPVNLVAPTISGPTVQGALLTALTGSWSGSPTTYAYSWKDCDSSGAHCVSIAGATATTLMLLSRDGGHTIRATVTATNRGGSTTAQTNPTAIVQADTTAPSIPTGLTLTGIGQSSIMLSWNASSDNVGVTGYRLSQGGTQVGTSLTTSYLYSGLACGTVYKLGVAAVDAAGNVSSTATVSATTIACPDTTAPSAPTGLVATSADQTNLWLSWNASTDNVGVTGYGVYVNGTLTSSLTGTSATLSGLSCGTSYTVAVDAVDAAGNRSTKTTVTAAAAACSAATAPSGLVAAYSFDEGTGTTVADASGNGNTGTIANATWTSAGKNGDAIYFNGANADVIVPDSSSLQLASGMTLEAWVNPSSVSSAWRDVIYKGNDNYYLEGTTDQSGVPGGDVTVAGSKAHAYGAGTLATNTWSYLATTYDGAVLNLYVNGSLVGSQTASGAITSTTNPLQIGGDSIYGQYFQGLIDDVRVYNRALSASQIQNDMNTAVASGTSTPDTTAPSTPSGVGVSSAGQTSLALVWSASSDNVGVAGYGVYRNASLVASPAGTGYTLTGLSCGTSYTVAVDAYDAAGNRSGKATITTSTAACPDTQAPSAPSGLAATFVTQSAVTLSWSASSDNVGVVGYDLLFGGLVVGTSPQTSYAFSGLSCNTAYTLGVDAYDAAGNRSAVSSLTITTNACADTSPPSAPANLLESGSTSSSITATWTASSDNVGVTGYRVFVDGSQAGTMATTSYTVTGLSCGTSHQVVVDAYDAAGNRSPQTSATMSAAACPAPPPGDTQPPSTPSGVGVSSAGQTSLALVWSASSDNVGVAGYGVYRNASLVASPAGTGYTLTGLSCGTSYTVAVDAYDAAGNRSGKATITTSTAACPDTQAPTVPTGVALATRTATSISINWTASTDNVGVAGYHLYLAGTAVGTATTTSYTFTGLTCNTNYTLGVDAYDAAGNHSSQATTAIATSACPDTQPPSTPGSLAVSSTTQTSASVSWTASSDNVGVTGYRAYVNGTQVGMSTTTSYVFSGLACGTSYSLGVAAVDAAGNVSTVATISAQTAACSAGGGAAGIYLAQAATGSGDGSSCANPKPVAFFNTASNWGSGKPIAPGTTVSLCGTITSSLTAQGSGTAGNPITIYFTSGAKLSQPACSGIACLVVDGRSYLTVDGGTNGIIENTNNGTNLGLHTSSTGISAVPCNNCEVKNLTIQNIYVHTGSGTEVDQTQVRAINFNGSNFSFDHNIVHDMGWAINFGNNGESNDRIYDNDIYHVDHGVIPSFGTSGGSTGPYFIYGNHFHDFQNWDNSSNGYHHDGIHCYTIAGGGAQHITDFYIYDNTFDGNVGTNATGWIFIEGGSGSGATPCSDATSNYWFFNNFGTYVDSPTATGYNGVFEVNSRGTEHWFNNTEVSNGANAGGSTCAFNSSPTDDSQLQFVNNVCASGNQLGGGCGAAWGSGSPDYNAYLDGGSNSFVCPPNFWPFSAWKTFQANVGGAGEAHSIQSATNSLNSAGVPQAGSPVLNLGTNLTSLCTGNLVPLCSDINGHPRPTSGTWDAGAFEVSK